MYIQLQIVSGEWEGERTRIPQGQKQKKFFLYNDVGAGK